MVLYMGTKTCRTTTLGSNINISSSRGALLLTCLIYGLTTSLAQSIVVSSDRVARDPLLLQIQSHVISEEQNTTTPPVIYVKSTASINNHAVYTCPKSCQCEYSSSSQTLEINCSSSKAWLGRNPVTFSEETSRMESAKLDLSDGVRILRITNALLDATSVPLIVPQVVKNSLTELDLEDVTIEPQSLFTTNGILRESQESLRKINIKSGNLLRGEYFYTGVSTATVRATLHPLKSLRRLDSLNICDSSSPSLATVVLQAMPPVNHLRAVNNSLYEIPYDSLSDQYSIQSIDLSRNHIALIPNGLLDGLPELKSLDVSQNRIFHLQEQVFIGLKSLRKLNISHNQIEYVDAEVFTPLRDIHSIDLSHNEVVQFFGPYFANNKKLEFLNMANMWVTGTFTTSDTSFRSLTEMEHLISTLERVEKLDISDNGMRSLPETLTHAPLLRQVYLHGNRWECSCQDRWFLDWITTSDVSVGQNNSTNDMWCFLRKINGEIHRYPFHQYLSNLTMTCTNANIIARTPYKFHAVMGKDKHLKCHAQKPHWPKITWITPTKRHISESESNNSKQTFKRSQYYTLGDPRVNSDGSLSLTNVTAKDYGLYRCIASYEDLNITHYVHLGMDVSVFRDVRAMSIFVGWIFSFSFLALVLLYQLVKHILYRLGVRCVSVSTTRQTTRVKAFFESMEQHKNTQLDWLRDNYNMQAKRIKDNCYSQLERLRDSYSNQSKNLGEIRDYGTQQLHTLRDQYNDQVRKVAGYSAHQLCKVRENYVFKRNQVCKFSSHQLLRLRETYKWQAQTLNKILENLPRGLNFDTCRGMGACGRTDSIYLDDMGDEFGVPQEMPPDVYHLHGRRSHADKMEHISLLIPPEFMSEYNWRSLEEGIVNRRLSFDHEAETVGDIEAIALREDDEDEFHEAEQELSESVSDNTPATLTLESSASSTRRESEISSEASTSHSHRENNINEETKIEKAPSPTIISASTSHSAGPSTTIKVITERHDENV